MEKYNVELKDKNGNVVLKHSLFANSFSVKDAVG